MNIENTSTQLPPDADSTDSPAPEQLTTRFDDLPLAVPLLDAIGDLGYEKMTPIQAQALPALLAGHDVAGQAQTGTGKTACFLLGSLDLLLRTERPESGAPRVLIVAPTRELAIQIIEDCAALVTYTDLKYTVACGGLSWTKQARAIQQGVDVVAGTPGRLLDLIGGNVLDLSQLDAIVIDEADRMFDMGFIDDLRAIMREAPRAGQRQAMLFSATLSYEVMRLAAQWLRKPLRFETKAEKITADKISQRIYHVSHREKPELLMGLLQKEQPTRSIVFVNRKSEGEALAWRLTQNGFQAVYLSGDLRQNKRLQIIDAMKDGKISILVATDVASRGIHVDDISHVFNYDIPQDPEDYVHRIGRTARAGASGHAITLACEDTVLALPALEKYLDYSLPVAYAEDEDFVTDRAGRFRRQRQPFVGWPPQSADGARGEEKEGDDKPPAKRRRRRRKPKRRDDD